MMRPGFEKRGCKPVFHLSLPSISIPGCKTVYIKTLGEGWNKTCCHWHRVLGTFIIWKSILQMYANLPAIHRITSTSHGAMYFSITSKPFTLEDERLVHLQPSPIWKGKWSEPNLQGIMFLPLIFRGVISSFLCICLLHVFTWTNKTPPHHQLFTNVTPVAWRHSTTQLRPSWISLNRGIKDIQETCWTKTCIPWDGW